VTREWLGESRLQWLRNLPVRQIQDSVALVHARPETAWNSPMPSASDNELEVAYSPLDRPVVAYGHIHLPYVRKTPKLRVGNAGSVGMPLDGDRRDRTCSSMERTPQCGASNTMLTARFATLAFAAFRTSNGLRAFYRLHNHRCLSQR
jgi:diadenosine tetraphosphatase ApaH/serine/threonine PP2A family protein phosphatase